MFKIERLYESLSYKLYNLNDASELFFKAVQKEWGTENVHTEKIKSDIGVRIMFNPLSLRVSWVLKVVSDFISSMLDFKIEKRRVDQMSMVNNSGHIIEIDASNTMW